MQAEGETGEQENFTSEQEVQEPPEAVQETDWVRLGGKELEEALGNESVKLVRADWLIRLAWTGGTLTRRQDTPLEAYVGLEELKQAGPGVLMGPSSPEEWLRVIVLSCPWLQPKHPDPYGENLHRIAEVLKHFVRDSENYSNGGKPYGVFIDYTALFQVPRTEEEHADFLLALPALHVFYSHPNTVVLKVTQFPAGYPHQGSFHYDLPEGANAKAYKERGWCFAESAVSGLVKSSNNNKVLDMGRYTRREHLWEVIHECKAWRSPPLHPSDFEGELDKKTFTSKEADFERAVKLYSAAFERHVGSATELDYRWLRWSADAAQQLARALEGARLLQTLNLEGNRIGEQGATAIKEVLQRSASLQTLSMMSNRIGPQGAALLGAVLQRNSALKTLELGDNGVGEQGAVALGAVLQQNSALQRLELSGNGIGQQGAVALGAALQKNSVLQMLELGGNGIGQQGAAALGQALLKNSTLRALNLGSNHIGAEGAAALSAALRSNCSLQKLELQFNSIGDDGAAALGQALLTNGTLQSLDLWRNGIQRQGAAALGQALESNRSLETLSLGVNKIGNSGAADMAKALQGKSSLQSLDLENNEISNDGALVLAEALEGNSALQSLILVANDFGSEAVEALRRAARARPTPLQLDW